MQLWGPFLGNLFGAPCQADATKVRIAACRPAALIMQTSLGPQVCMRMQARTKLGWQPKHTEGFYEGIALAGAAGSLGVMG